MKINIHLIYKEKDKILGDQDDQKCLKAHLKLGQKVTSCSHIPPNQFIRYRPASVAGYTGFFASNFLTLPEVLSHIENSRSKAVVKQAMCDRGYRGKKTFGETHIILLGAPLNWDNRYQQRDKKKKHCRRRVAIEHIIGHLKAGFRLIRNFLKGK